MPRGSKKASKKATEPQSPPLPLHLADEEEWYEYEDFERPSPPSVSETVQEQRKGAVLARSEIIKAIEAGQIVVEPYDPNALSAASIDLTLSNEFRYYKPGNKVVRVTEETNYEDVTVKVEVPKGEGYLLLPGQLCLGITEENIKLAPGICGLLEGRSRFARLGLLVHITAGFMNPGINNRQVLEIFNASNQPLELIPGTKICQFIFIKMAGEASYQGRFSTQVQL